jgi:hypothetical protein
MPRATSSRRVDIRTTSARRTRYFTAARRRNLSLSEWARQRLDAAAEAELAIAVPSEPTDADVTAALEARGALRGSRLRARIEALEETSWR